MVSFIFTTLTLLKIRGELFCIMVWVYLMFPHDWIQVVHLRHEHHSEDDVFSLHSIGWHTVSISLRADAINLDHMVKVVSARPFPCEASHFPFEISKYWGTWRVTVRLGKRPIPHQT